MDYSNPSGEQAAVAIVKYPSKIPPGQKGYLGPILFNPGLLFPLVYLVHSCSFFGRWTRRIRCSDGAQQRAGLC